MSMVQGKDENQATVYLVYEGRLFFLSLCLGAAFSSEIKTVC